MVNVPCSYVTLLDAPAQLTLASPTLNVNLPIPNGALVGDPIPMFFRILTPSNSKELKLLIRVNGTEQFSSPVGLSGSHCYTINEVINGGLLNVGNNEIRFGLSGDIGTMSISDVCVFFK